MSGSIQVWSLPGSGLEATSPTDSGIGEGEVVGGPVVDQATELRKKAVAEELEKVGEAGNWCEGEGRAIKNVC